MSPRAYSPELYQHCRRILREANRSDCPTVSDCYNPSMTNPMKNLLSLSLACNLLLSPKSISADAGPMADSKKVSAVEYLYADVSDANSILGTIDSGLLSTYRGKDRAAWEQFYREKRAKLAKKLERLSGSGLSGGDTRAIAAMRKQMKCPPEKPQGSLILGGPSVWLQNRDCA